MQWKDSLQSSVHANKSFDQNGYMATTCDDPTNKLNLFSQNGSFTGKSLSTLQYPRYIGFDSKSHFIQILQSQISIYNSIKRKLLFYIVEIQLKFNSLHYLIKLIYSLTCLFSFRK